MFSLCERSLLHCDERFNSMELRWRDRNTLRSVIRHCTFLLHTHLMLHLFLWCLHRECCRFFGDDGLTPKVVFTKVAPFGLLWILTSYLYLQALRKINTTDASALFCCNKAFVFLLSWIVLRDRFMGVRVSPSAQLWLCVCCASQRVKDREREHHWTKTRKITIWYWLFYWYLMSRYCPTPNLQCWYQLIPIYAIGEFTHIALELWCPAACIDNDKVKKFSKSK